MVLTVVKIEARYQKKKKKEKREKKRTAKHHLKKRRKFLPIKYIQLLGQKPIAFQLNGTLEHNSIKCEYKFSIYVL